MSRLDGRQIKNNTISGYQIEDESLTGADIKDGSIEGIDIKDETLTFNNFHTSISWKESVNSIELLPSNNNNIGDARVVKSNSLIYIWDGNNWVTSATASNIDWANITSKPIIISGSSIFGAGGIAVSCIHNLNTLSYRVNITPTSNSFGYLGEYWVVKNLNTIDVYKSGSASNITFDWFIISN